MAWVLLDDNFPLHPKAIKAGPVAAYLYVCGLCYCRRYHTEGFIPSQAVANLGLTVRPKKMIDALVEAGLWDVTSGGYSIHDYDAFYEDVTEKALKSERRLNGRKGGIERRRLNKFASEQRGVGTGSGSDRSSEEEAFDAFWELYPRHDGKQPARDVWQKLKPDVATQSAIAADLEQRKRSPQWAKDNGQYIPHARTYLNQRRWQDGYQGPEPEQEAPPWQCPHLEECSHKAMCAHKLNMPQKYPVHDKAHAS